MKYESKNKKSIRINKNHDVYIKHTYYWKITYFDPLRSPSSVHKEILRINEIHITYKKIMKYDVSEI